MRWLQLAMRIFPFIVGAVHGVEILHSPAAGPVKQDAAVEMVKAMLAATDAGAARELVNDSDVETATRNIISAYVALQNVIARKAAATSAGGN